MKCPRCVQAIHRGADPCPHCGYTIAEADARFGTDEVAISRLSDRGGLVRSRERARVEKALDRFAARFPQLFLAVHTGAGGHGSSLRQFGFWLLNRAAFADVPVDRPNEAGILLVLDPDTKSAGLTWGYMLDPYLTEEDSFLCLCRAHAYWLEGRYADGILRFTEQLSAILARRSQLARWDPSRFERRVVAPAPAGNIARRLRVGTGRSASSDNRRKKEVRK